MITLLRVHEILDPCPLPDQTDILIADGRIAAIGTRIPVPEGFPVDVIELPEGRAVPGFIDQHAHVTGGGGEGGFSTRCPEITGEEIAAAGVTTVVGVLGTDCISRSLENLLAKVRALGEYGVNAYMYTGAYRVPPPTLTGDIVRDIVLVPEILGIGEIAVSDHRSSQPTDDELARIVSEARLGGLLTGKSGICHFHMGSGPRGLDPLRRILEITEIPPRQIIPTHVNRDRRLLAEAAEYARTFGAAVDVTAFDFPSEEAVGTVEAVATLIEAGVAPELITLSSDCNGSIPAYNRDGSFAGMRTGAISALLADWRKLATSGTLPLSDALGMVGRNVATVLGLHPRKGTLAIGADADITVFDDGLNVKAVFARGKRLI